MAAGRVGDHDGLFPGEKVVCEDDIFPVRGEGDRFRRAMVPELEDVVADDDRAVSPVLLVEREVEFGEGPGFSGLIGDPADAGVGIVFCGIVDEQVACHHEVHGLVDPRAPASVAEGVPGEGDIRAAFQ